MNREVTTLMERVLYEVKKIVVGQDHFLERVMVAMLAQGHLLVEVFGPGEDAYREDAGAHGAAHSAASIHPRSRPADLGRYAHLQPEERRVSRLRSARCSATCCSPMRSTGAGQSAKRAAGSDAGAQVTIAGETHKVPEPFLVMATEPDRNRGSPIHCRRRRSTAS